MKQLMPWRVIVLAVAVLASGCASDSGRSDQTFEAGNGSGSAEPVAAPVDTPTETHEGPSDHTPPAISDSCSTFQPPLETLVGAPLEVHEHRVPVDGTDLLAQDGSDLGAVVGTRYGCTLGVIPEEPDVGLSPHVFDLDDADAKEVFLSGLPGDLRPLSASHPWMTNSYISVMGPSTRWLVTCSSTVTLRVVTLTALGDSASLNNSDVVTMLAETAC